MNLGILIVASLLGLIIIICLTVLILNRKNEKLIDDILLKKLENIENTNKISFRESMDLTELPIITFYNNKIKLNFVLDSGSSNSAINKEMLSVLQYTDSLGGKEIIGIDGELQQVDKINIILHNGENHFDIELLATDLQDAFDHVKQSSGVQLHGLIGSDFLEKYKYVLDYSKYIAYTK